MISVIEFLGIIALAGVLAQGMAWSAQLVSVRRSAHVTSHRNNRISDHAGERVYFGETTKAHFHYVRRRTRYHVHCAVDYQIDGCVGKGMVA